MNALMIKALAFAAILIIATIAVVTSLDIDIMSDSVNAITMGGAIAIAVITAAVVVKYNKEEAIVFPWTHIFDGSFKSMHRCTVCGMPLAGSDRKLMLFNAAAEICCADNCIMSMY